MSGSGTWQPPAPGGTASVAWAVGAPGGAPAVPRRTVDGGAVLRLVGAGLLLLAAGLTAVAPFTDLFSVSYDGEATSSATGWEDDAAAPGETVLFGIPLVVAAALLLGAAGLAAAAHRLAGLRRTAVAGAVLAVGVFAAVTWLVIGYSRDLVATVTGIGDGSLADAETGSGVLLATLALLTGLGGLAALLVGAALDRTSSAAEGLR
ncbi:hypothetical protein JKP75_15895 [Blastococcus sp. TML/M2B]|uniref:hypothetical protein n=1 Tax=unclassified Blastococcus TaxID=2619396 RepID=UPI00190D6226|nr:MULTISPECIES: hypothetical protein [unclassified Blastococcus]MBN1093905.1 hypothetical protein [Blastococcus sp. TML/M2B]MBN1095977.1 hypothetical protein [Blastococcus sp. TML/C7B]